MPGWLGNMVILPYYEAVAVTWGELQAGPYGGAARGRLMTPG